MEKLITHAECLLGIIILITLGVVLFIVAGHVLFIFIEICAQLSRRLIKHLDKYFED